MSFFVSIDKDFQHTSKRIGICRETISNTEYSIFIPSGYRLRRRNRNTITIRSSWKVCAVTVSINCHDYARADDIRGQLSLPRGGDRLLLDSDPRTRLHSAAVAVVEMMIGSLPSLIGIRVWGIVERHAGEIIREESKQIDATSSEKMMIIAVFQAN